MSSKFKYNLHFFCFTFYILKIRKTLAARLSDLAQITALGQHWAYRPMRGGGGSVITVEADALWGIDAIP